MTNEWKSQNTPKSLEILVHMFDNHFATYILFSYLTN